MATLIKPQAGTRVLWEESSPHGVYFPNVVHEGVVIDARGNDPWRAPNDYFVSVVCGPADVRNVAWRKLVY